MYNVTELVAEFDKINHKRIKSILVDRKNHSFSNLKELAYFSRENTIFTSYQKEITGVPRTNEAGKELYIGNNLIWLDLDFEVNLKTLKKKLEKVNLTSFAFYTSSYYSKSQAHARLCIVCDETLSLDDWYCIRVYANQILTILGLTKTQDNHIYSLSSYLKSIKGDFEKEDLVYNKGQKFKWIKQEEVIRKTSKKKETIEKACYGDLGNLANFLNNFSSIEKVKIRDNNNTISICFTNISEKTPFGYFIYMNNPWTVYHRNKDPQYLSNLLSPLDFEKFKNFYLNSNYINSDPFKDDLKTNKTINVDFVDQSLFSRHSLIFLESSTGSGKTTAISEFISKNPQKSVLFISVNRMQAVALYKSLSKEGIGVTCYLKHSLKEYQYEKKGRKKVSIYNETFENEAQNSNLPSRLICGVLSLHHLIKNDKLLKNYDYIIIDEISTLPNNISRSVGLVYERLGSFELGLKAFKLLLTNSEKVICMDGFLSNSIIKCISDISKKDPYIIKNKMPTNKKIEIYVCSGGQPKFEGKGTCKKYLSKIMEDIDKASFNVTKRLMVVALSSLDLSNTLGDFLRKQYPDKVIQVFNSELTEKDGLMAIQMFEDLDKYMEDYKIDILIYSPTITTGIDIPQAKGTNVYQIISGDQLSSHTNYQMTMRGRKAKVYRILMAKSLMVNKKINSSFDDFIIESLDEIKNSIPFKSSKSIKWKSRNFQTTGLLLSYYRLEYNISEKEWKKVNDLKSLINALKLMSLQYNYDLEGVKIALKIDRANINFQNELYERGNTGYKQYINFLKHEHCKISVEEDIDYNSPHYYGKYNNNSTKYKESHKEDYSNKLKELNCWKEEYKELKSDRLFKILKIAKVFNVLKTKIRIGKYSNDELLELYDTLYKKSFLKEYKEFREVLCKNTNKEKIAVIKSILNIIFNIKDTEKRYSIVIE